MFKNTCSTWVKFLHRCRELKKSLHSCIFYAIATTRSQELTHPQDDVVLIVGIFAENCGCSYIKHTCCGQQVQLNVMLCVYREQIHTCEGKRLWCAATLWKIASISAMLDFWGVIVPNWIPTMVCSFRQLMQFRLMMLIKPVEKNFIAFADGPMWMSSEWLNIIPHQVMSNIQERISKIISNNYKINSLIHFNLIQSFIHFIFLNNPI